MTDEHKTDLDLIQEVQELRAKVAALEGKERERGQGEADKRRLQEQLAQAQKMEAIGTLAGGVAHEFNNINATIIGYADLTLQTEDLSDAARRSMETIRRAAVRAADLSRSLLAFSRREVGKRVPVSMRRVVDEVLAMTQDEFTTQGIEVVVRHQCRAREAMAEPGMLTQVLMNLVINARHAMLESRVKRLTIETGSEGGKLYIRVTDTGCGIPERHISRIFEPFFTTKGSLAGGGVYNGKARGTGLGLSVCHSIVEAHGGEIKVESQVGKGSTFTVCLPERSRAGRELTVPEGASEEGVPRIMVVDDDDSITELLVDILERAGYDADGFTDPRKALRALWRRTYSVAFIDLQMPEMTGGDLMQRIDRLPPGKRPVKLVVTGRPDASEESLRGLGVFAMLAKPFSAHQALRMVHRALAASNRGPG